MQKHVLLPLILAASVLAACDKAPPGTEIPPVPAVMTAPAMFKTNKADLAKAPNLNPAPLGLELGYAKRDNLKDIKGPKFEKEGEVSYATEGLGALGIEHLEGLAFNFDSNDTLMATTMLFPKTVDMDLDNKFFKSMLSTLSSKYKLVEKQIPFVGNAYAVFKHGDSVISLDAPHLSNTMTVKYTTMAYLEKEQDKKEQSNAQAEQRKKAAL